MNRMLGIALAAIAALTANGVAHAQMRYRESPDPRADFQRSSAPQFDAQQGLQPRQEFAPPGRLSPEERRQLRRDIHDAGRELYRRGPGPHPQGASPQ